MNVEAEFSASGQVKLSVPSEVMRRIVAPMVSGMVSATILTLAVIPAIFLIWQEGKLKRIPPG